MMIGRRRGQKGRWIRKTGEEEERGGGNKSRREGLGGEGRKERKAGTFSIPNG